MSTSIDDLINLKEQAVGFALLALLNLDRDEHPELVAGAQAIHAMSNRYDAAEEDPRIHEMRGLPAWIVFEDLDDDFYVVSEAKRSGPYSNYEDALIVAEKRNAVTFS